ncbi:UNVERIFIED_CONTAM: hypothetical protein K2H54_017119 [Gekko kuhli]
MLPTEVEGLLGSPGMEFWTSPASYDEVNGNTELDDSADLISPELEEGFFQVLDLALACKNTAVTCSVLELPNH